MIGPILGGRPPRLKLNANFNLVCDGNSLTAGVGGYPWPRAIRYGAEFKDIFVNGVQYSTANPVDYKNIAVSGQTIRQMNGLDGGSAADVDGCWMDGKINALLPWETTNTLALAGRTVAQAVQDQTDYNTARKALHPDWYIIAMTVLPRSAGSDAANIALNAKIDQYNAYILANYRAMGANAVIDVRQSGSPFNLSDYAVSTFENARNTTGLWANTGTDSVGNVTHLSSPGYDALNLQIIAPALKRLPAR